MFNSPFNQFNKQKVPFRLLTETTNTAKNTDRGLTYNNASNGTIECPAGALPEGAVIQHLNTGTITANAGSGVTWIKSDDGTTVTTLATTAKGEQIIITKTAVADTFIVKVA